MVVINVSLGHAPNGEIVWGIAYDSELSVDGTCGSAIEKSHLDKMLPKTNSKEEYWLEVAKHASSMLVDKLKDKELIYNFEFVCNKITYKRTK